MFYRESIGIIGIFYREFIGIIGIFYREFIGIIFPDSLPTTSKGIYLLADRCCGESACALCTKLILKPCSNSTDVSS